MILVKLFLHVSKAEQRRRFLIRLHNPDKRWKFSMGDLAERARWDDYQAAFEDLDEVGAYRLGDYWEGITARSDKRLILDPNEFYILASKEKLHMTIAAVLLVFLGIIERKPEAATA